MYELELSAAKNIALEAGKIILKYFEGEQRIEVKADDSPVTIADKEVNKLVIEKLAEVFPNDGVIGEEESTAEYGMGRRWICDPIDGTIAFVWGLPTAMFSLALAVASVPVVAVAYDPFLNKIYTAIKGEGSFCNEIKLSVSSKQLKGGHVAITAGVEKIMKLPFIPRIQETGAHIAVFSGCVYKSCLVAKGKFEGYIESGVSGYDMAAVTLIVKEAGGQVTATNGDELDFSKPFTGAIVSNGKVHAELVEIFNS